jgi:predicted  nucleic acid-binding Zn-ribbon protein
MSARYVWNELRKLVEIDHELTNKNEALRHLRQETDALASQIPLAQQAVANAKDALVRVKKTIDMLELSLKETKDLDAKKQRFLETSSNPKEYTALEKECAVLSAKIDKLEEDICNALDAKKSAETKLEKVTSEHAELVEKHAESEKNADAQSTTLREEVAALEKQWDDQAALVPEQLQKSYKDIRGRIKNPVVPVVSKSCSVCFTALLPHEASSITTHTVIRCKGCYRFLFLQESAVPEEVVPEKADAS